MTTGKWYCEITNQAGITHQIGIVKLDEAVLLGSNVPIVDYTWGWGFINDGVGLRLRSDLFGGGNSTDAAFGATGSNYVAGDTIGLAYDADNQEFSIYKNGTLVGNTTSSWTNAPTPGTYAFAISLNASNAAVDFNFGQRPFAYTPPTNHKSLCTQNLDDPLIADGSDYFDILRYQGNGASSPGGSGSTQDFSNFSFAPSFVWIKDRTQNGHNHNLVDIVRGAPNLLLSDSTSSEIADSTDGFTGFTSDGFTLGDNGQGTQSLELNKNGNNYVAWAWYGGDTRCYTGEVSGNFNAGQGPNLIFDGSTSTMANASGSSSNTFTWNLSSPITVNQSLEVYFSSGYSKFKVNGGTQTGVLNSGTWHNLSFTGSLYSLEVQGDTGNNTAARLSAIRIDGTIVTDPCLNTTGTVNSIVKANASSGFSCVTWTGDGGSSTTVGHGLSSAPSLIFIKARTFTSDWHTYAQPLDATGRYQVYLNKTDGSTDFGSSFFKGSNNVINLNSGSVGINGSNNDYVAYCFAPVAGYSAFGTYEGNGSNDGPFVYTGFAPAFVMFKRYDAAGDWIIFDNERNTHDGNYREKVLYPNKANPEETSANGDTMLFLSNGFKLNNVTYAYWNASGGDYLWVAFAENPFQANGGLAR